MRLAILSDIHGNYEALTSAFTDMESQEVDKIVCLGDVVGYGANPSECLELLRSRTNLILLGNHDKAVFDHLLWEEFSDLAATAIQWTAQQLSREEIGFLRSLPLTLTSDNMLFVHSTPKNPENWEYVFSHFEARMYNEWFRERLCFVGHTHIPAVFSMRPDVQGYDHENRFIINVGSIGQPRDGDPRLSYGILDTVAGTYENIRIAYDIETAAMKIKDSGLPRRLGDRLHLGR